MTISPAPTLDDYRSLESICTQLRGTLSLAEEGLANYEEENQRLKAALREVYEVWAGSDGMIPETAPEAYQERLILQMRDAAARGLGMTPAPQTGDESPKRVLTVTSDGDSIASPSKEIAP